MHDEILLICLEPQDFQGAFKLVLEDTQDNFATWSEGELKVRFTCLSWKFIIIFFFFFVICVCALARVYVGTYGLGRALARLGRGLRIKRFF